MKLKNLYSRMIADATKNTGLSVTQVVRRLLSVAVADIDKKPLLDSILCGIHIILQMYQLLICSGNASNSMLCKLASDPICW